MPSSNFKQYFHLVLVIIVAILLRLYFQIGHIFSDDAYYSYLSFTMQNGEFAKDYLGYPVFPLRIAFTGLTAFSMNIFGTNESATLILPFCVFTSKYFISLQNCSTLYRK